MARIMMDQVLQATLIAPSIRHGQVENGRLSTATTAPRAAISSTISVNGSAKCRISHSLYSSRRRPAIEKTMMVRRAAVGPVRMEEGATAVSDTSADAGPVDSEESAPFPSGSNIDVSPHVAVLKRAAKTKKVPPTEVFAAIRAIEKAKVDPSNFLEKLGGTQSPGRTWMLVFTAGKDLVREALNGGPGGGQYLPVTAIQNFDAAALRIENGVYLGPLGALAFEGRFSFKKRVLAFIFTTLKIKVGILPAFTVNLNVGRKKADAEARVPGNSDPFFIWFYADDEIIVAKGRGGGLAYWCRCKRVNYNSENF